MKGSMSNLKTNPEWAKYKNLMKERPHQFRPCKEVDIITDEQLVAKYEEQTGRTIGVVYESPYRIMVVDLVWDGTSYFAYERLLPAVDKGAVVIVPILDGKFVLLNQFRHALRTHQYAFPRGFAEQGLTAEENCKKELQEELGCDAENIEFLGTLISDSGLSGDRVNVYRCEISSYEVKQGYEGIAAVLELSAEEFSKCIAEGRIDDGFSLAAYAMCMSKGLDLHSNC